MLRLDGIEAGYGDVVAVRAVSLEVRAGEIVALIGGNGAGKTTTLRAISGLLPLRPVFLLSPNPGPSASAWSRSRPGRSPRAASTWSAPSSST